MYFLFIIEILRNTNIDLFAYFLVKVDYQLIFGMRCRTASKFYDVTHMKWRHLN